MIKSFYIAGIDLICLSREIQYDLKSKLISLLALYLAFK